MGGTFLRRWRRVDDFLGDGIGDVVLNPAILTGGGRVTAHTPDQSLVDFANQTFCDRIPASRIVSDQIDGLAGSS
jgi:hypothetical protein